jgi:hypothetical protein
MASTEIVTAYPNPTTNFITFDFHGTDASLIRITDLSGRLVAEQNVSGMRTFTYSTEKLNAGMYVYFVVGKGKFYSNGKIIIH